MFSRKKFTSSWNDVSLFLLTATIRIFCIKFVYLPCSEHSCCACTSRRLLSSYTQPWTCILCTMSVRFFYLLPNRIIEVNSDSFQNPMQMGSSKGCVAGKGGHCFMKRCTRKCKATKERQSVVRTYGCSDSAHAGGRAISSDGNTASAAEMMDAKWCKKYAGQMRNVCAKQSNDARTTLPLGAEFRHATYAANFGALQVSAWTPCWQRSLLLTALRKSPDRERICRPD